MPLICGDIKVRFLIKKIEYLSLSSKTTNTDLYIYIQVLLTNMQFYCKNNFFSGLRFFNTKYLDMWFRLCNFAPRNTDEVKETTETNKTEVFRFVL